MSFASRLIQFINYWSPKHQNIESCIRRFTHDFFFQERELYPHHFKFIQFALARCVKSSTAVAVLIGTHHCARSSSAKKYEVYEEKRYQCV